MMLRLLSLSAAVLFTSAAFGQVITVTAQERYMEGTTVSNNLGEITTNGPIRVDAPEGDFGSWIYAHSVFGNITAGGDQRSGFNGTDTILVDYYTMSMSGGGGPDTSGSATFTNKCQFTFTVNEAATYTLNGQFACGPFVQVAFSLVGPGTNVQADTSTGEVIFAGTTGTFAPGSYTFTLFGTGTVTYVGPGGNGSGAGGSLPCLTLVVAPAGGCSADFNGDTVADFFDYLDFVDAFASNLPSADFNGDTVIDFFDYLDFVDVFSTGC